MGSDAKDALKALGEWAYRTPAMLTGSLVRACLDLGAIRQPTNEATLASVATELAKHAATLELRLIDAAVRNPPPIYITAPKGWCPNPAAHQKPESSTPSDPAKERTPASGTASK